MDEKKVESIIFGLKETIAEQKAEIERLTEAHERIAWSKQEYLDWVHGFLSTHTDMKYREEKFEMFDRDWMCGVFWAKIEGSIEYIIDLEKQRNELQKQVDELKAKNEHLESENNRLIGEVSKLLDEGWDIMDKEAEICYNRGYEQAVKDTAKEILQELYETPHEYHEKKILEIAKRKGVEVE